MRRALTRLILAMAALVAAVAFFVRFTAPPAAIRLGGTLPDAAAIGAYHVHTSRSDGTGSVAEIARAAAAAGLDFVVFTDHGDATAPPMAPAYVHGVLCIDAVEINTANGHLVALGLAAPAPYPLAGEARDVVDDIHRLGGAAIAAHPDSPSTDLRWRGAARYDGVEWVNADAEWRDNSPWQLLGAAARSIVRGPESIASLFDRPPFTLQRWDDALRTRRVVGLAALDAHARLAGDDEDWGGPAIAWPSYQTLFRTLANVVLLDAPLSGRAREDAEALLSSLARGRAFSVVTAFASPVALEFSVEQRGVRAGIGQVIEAWDGNAAATLIATVRQAPGATLVVRGGGRIAAEGQGRVELRRPLAAGAYRLEATLPGSTFPWIVSNPIYLGSPVDAGSAGPQPGEIGEAIFIAADGTWTVERDRLSTGTISPRSSGVRFDFAIAPGPPAAQYAAVVAPAPRGAGLEHVAFTARADRPMRLSVQVRMPGSGADGQRWQRSIYVDDLPRDHVVRLADMERAGETTTLRPIVARVESLLFVVDTVNTAPGTRGTVWITNVRVGVVAAGVASARSER